MYIQLPLDTHLILVSLLYHIPCPVNKIYVILSQSEFDNIDDLKFQNIKNILKRVKVKNLTEFEALKVFDVMDINTVKSHVVSNLTKAIALRKEIEFPLVMKILSSEIQHKTDTGGVELNIISEEDLKIRYGKLFKVFEKLKIEDDKKQFIIQKMETGIAEIILGYRVDELVGPIVVVGSGGVLSELYDDKSVRIAPVDFKEAKNMISEVKSFMIFNGYRGLPKVNIDVLARAIVNISQLAFVNEIREAEINPVIIKKEGIVAVDGLINLS